MPMEVGKNLAPKDGAKRFSFEPTMGSAQAMQANIEMLVDRYDEGPPHRQVASRQPNLQIAPSTGNQKEKTIASIVPVNPVQQMRRIDRRASVKSWGNFTDNCRLGGDVGTPDKV